MKSVESSLFRSQHGEDRILASEFGKNSNGYFVEVGSYNGESYSNTYYLEKSLGWKGILVEADPALHAQGQKVRPASLSVNCAAVGPDSPDTVSFEVVEGCKWVSSLAVSHSMLQRIEDIPTQIKKVTVPARTLDSILDELGAPTGIDVVSIDVEGYEWPVLQGFTASRWKPRVIILERNDHFPDRQIMRYMHEHGYGWRRTTGCNDWFYADASSRAAYRPALFWKYYLPKYATLYKPWVKGPLTLFSKRILRKLGVLEKVRRLAGKKPVKKN